MTVKGRGVRYFQVIGDDLERFYGDMSHEIIKKFANAMKSCTIKQTARKSVEASFTFYIGVHLRIASLPHQIECIAPRDRFGTTEASIKTTFRFTDLRDFITVSHSFYICRCVLPFVSVSPAT